MLSEIRSFFADWDLPFLVAYLGSVAVVSGLGFWFGSRAAAHRGSTPARQWLAGVGVGSAASVLAHPIHLVTLLMGLFAAGPLVALQIVAVAGGLGLAMSALIGGGVLLGRRMRARPRPHVDGT